MRRTSIQDMKAAVRLLNQILGVADGAPGSFVLEGAYGGWQLQRVREGTSIETVTYGFRPKREIYDIIHHIRYGIIVADAKNRIPETV